MPAVDVLPECYSRVLNGGSEHTVATLRTVSSGSVATRAGRVVLALSVGAALVGPGVAIGVLTNRWLAIALAVLVVLGTAAIANRTARRLRGLAAMLDESERRYRALVEWLPLVTYRRAADDRHEWLDVSPRIDSLLGYSAEDWLGEHELFTRLLDSEDRERVLARDRSGGPVREEYRVHTRDGRLLWLRDESVAVRDGSGRPLYVQGCLLDISEQKAFDAEREAVRSAERIAVRRANEKQKRIDLLAEVSQVLGSPSHYERGVHSVANMVTRHIADWCIVSILDTEGELVPLAIAPAEPRSTREMRNEEHELVDEQEAQSVIETRAAQIGESRLCVPLVARERALGVLTLISTTSGRTCGSDDLAFAEDLAGRIAVALDNAQLCKEVEERADAARVLTYVADGVFLIDRSGVLRLWNPAAEAITGLEARTVVGRVATDVFPAWNRVAEEIPISESPDPAHPKTILLETPNGERWISISGVDFFGGTVYAFRDFTEERRLEQLKTEFVATASHELRTPLAAVYGAAQTLRRHDFALDEAGRERFVSLIAEEAERLNRIVNEILLANQLDSGRLDVTGEPFDALELVQRVAEGARAHIPPELTIEIVPPRSNATVPVDRDRVRQVLVNLVENAIKYSPDGGIVEIGLEAGDTRVRFWVKDNGLGIPRDEQARIFDKFYRLDPEMTRGVGGTGLGLYICSELVARMGGQISVESVLGEGSTFSFDLPCVQGVALRMPSGELPTAASA
jgi:PAS domain S-box-containing protein